MAPCWIHILVEVKVINILATSHASEHQCAHRNMQSMAFPHLQAFDSEPDKILMAKPGLLEQVAGTCRAQSLT